MRLLPPKQRSAVVLRYYLDLSELETARILRVSVGTVKSQTAEGLVKLRHLLEGSMSEIDNRLGDRLQNLVAGEEPSAALRKRHRAAAAPAARSKAAPLGGTPVDLGQYCIGWLTVP